MFGYLDETLSLVFDILQATCIFVFLTSNTYKFNKVITLQPNLRAELRHLIAVFLKCTTGVTVSYSFKEKKTAVGELWIKVCC